MCHTYTPSTYTQYTHTQYTHTQYTHTQYTHTQYTHKHPPPLHRARDDAPPGLPSDSPVVVFEVELLGFDKDPSWMQCEAAEKLRQGVVLKEQGNGLFKEVVFFLCVYMYVCVCCMYDMCVCCMYDMCVCVCVCVCVCDISTLPSRFHPPLSFPPFHMQGAWKHAEQKYVKALRVLTAAGHEAESDTQAADISSQKLAVMLNLAAIGSRTQQHGDTITWCNKAIKYDVVLVCILFWCVVCGVWLFVLVCV